MDSVLTPMAVVGLVAGAIILAFCWLLLVTRMGRPLDLRLKGLGIELHIDTSSNQADVNPAPTERELRDVH